MECPEERTVNLLSDDTDNVASLEYALDVSHSPASLWTSSHYFMGLSPPLKHLYLTQWFLKTNLRSWLE